MKITWLSDSGGRTLPGRRRSLLVRSSRPRKHLYTTGSPVARTYRRHDPCGLWPVLRCCLQDTQPSMKQHVKQYPSYLAGGYCGMADSEL
jgi:hypothetical protein